MAKKYDAVIAVGSYTNAAGEVKKRYLNIGAVMESEHGPYLLLDAHILSMQVFALANKERRDSVLVSLFDPNRERGSNDPLPVGDDVPF
jgi:hypothetical protein